MMNNLIHYWMVYMGDVATFLLATTLVLTLLYVPYTLLLRKEHFFRQNRFTLLAILALSLVLPFCDVHALYPGELLAGLFSKPALEPEAIVEFSSTEQIASTTPLEPIEFTEAHIRPLGIMPWLCQLYVMGTLIALAIRLWQFARMRRLIRKGCLWSDTEDGITIHCHAEDVAPCSWMRHIVISEHDYRHHRHEILLHEKGHVRCLHSWDILLLTLVQTIQWYNPFAYMLGASLRDVHEYEADDYVLRQGVTASEYQTLLLKTAVGNSVYAFANNFNHSLIKNRIVMMKNKKSNLWSRYKALYILPLVVVLLCAFATPEVVNIVTIHGVEDIDKRLYKQLDNMLLMYGDEIVETDRFLELLYSNRTSDDVLYAAVPNKKGVKQIRKLFVPRILWMPETDMEDLYHSTKNEKTKNGVLILQRKQSTPTIPSFSSGTNDFMIEGHVSSDIKDVAYQITLKDDNGQTSESVVHVKDGKFFYHAQLDKPIKGRIRAIFEDGSLCQAWIEEIFYPGCKLNILVMDNTYTAHNTAYTAK